MATIVKASKVSGPALPATGTASPGPEWGRHRPANRARVWPVAAQAPEAPEGTSSPPLPPPTPHTSRQQKDNPTAVLNRAQAERRLSSSKEIRNLLKVGRNKEWFIHG